MSDVRENQTQFEHLLAGLTDGDLSPEQLEKLQLLLREEDQRLQQLVDHVILDTMLHEESGTESLEELVDLFSDAPPDRQLPDAAEAKPQPRKYSRLAGWLTLAVTVAVVVFMAGSLNDSARASAASVVRVAMDTHGQPIERVYVVDVARSDSAAVSGVVPDARVATQGDQFWVEMQSRRGRWRWGRTADGEMWLTLGRKWALHINEDEVGVPLRQIGDIYSLRVESLLHDVLQNFDLQQAAGDDLTHVIVARSRGSRPRWIRQATLEIDTETKAVRKLVIVRGFSAERTSTITFTLVASRVADESLFRPEGHLEAPYHMISRDTAEDRRGEILKEWFGTKAAHWLKTKDHNR